MKEFIELPSKEVVRRDKIIAVRLGELDRSIPGVTFPPRVLVDYLCGAHGHNVIVIDCKSESEARLMLDGITKQLATTDKAASTGENGGNRE